MADEHEINEMLIKESFLFFLLELWRISSGESKGDKFSFKDRPYMLGIAQDDFNFQVILKSAQCFPAGTRVLTHMGDKYIEDIRPGDLVLTAANGMTRVKAILSRIAESTIILRTNDNTSLEITPNHRVFCVPFSKSLPYLERKTVEVEAGKLRVGDSLLVPMFNLGMEPSQGVKYKRDCRSSVIEKIERGRRNVKVFNFETESPEHSYIANGFGVKNCGVTELMAARALHSAGWHKKNILYAFPALSQLRQLVGARIRPAVESNPELFKRITGALNLEQIQMGGNTLYFRGVQTRRQMISVDVSELYVDELDTAVLEASKNNFGNVLYTLEKRLGAAKNAKKYYFSTPSFSGMGIHAEYAGDDTNPGSDQREWLIVCRFCSKEQQLTWDDNIIDRNENKTGISEYTPDVHRVCSACKNEFTVQDVLSGRWVAGKPHLSNICHGYHISKLLNAEPKLNQMMLDSMNPMKEQEFRCSDLGIPFEPKGSKLTDDILELARNSGKHVILQSSLEPTYMGADIGRVIHAQIGVPTPKNEIKILWAGEVKGYEDLDKLMKRFNVRFGVIDAQPGGLEQKEFALAHPGRIRAAYYSTYLEKEKDVFKDRDEVIIHVNRTLVMSMVIQAFYSNRVILPVDIKTVKDYYKMMKAPVKATQEDATGNMKTYFPPVSTPDHLFHAFVYLLAAIEKRPRESIFLPKGLFW